MLRLVLLFVVNDTQFFLSHRLNIALAAKSKGWSVHVATPYDKFAVELANLGFVHHVWSVSRYGGNPIYELRSIFLLYQIFRNLRPDIVHAVTIKPVLYSGTIAPLARIKALVLAISGLGQVFTSSSLLAQLRMNVLRFFYVLAFRHKNSKVIVQNSNDADVLKFALRSDQSVLIPGAGVDPDTFLFSPLPTQHPIVILAGRLLWTKGVGVFVEAARMLKERMPGVRFVIVGEPDHGNPDAVPISLLKKWDAEGVIEWWGRRSDMPEVLSQASVVCSPTYYGEGIPKILIEAAFCGRPIVATDWPGCRDIVENGINGCLVEPKNSHKVADALSRLLASKALMEEFGANGRRIALERFSSTRIVEQTMDVYQGLVRG